MPRTPDAFEGKVTFANIPSVPNEGGGDLAYVNGAWVLVDSTGPFDPRTGGGGISEAQHRILRQLIHFIGEGPAEGFASGAYKETLPAGDPFPTSVIWWESSSKLKKLVERTVTWTGASPTTDEWKIYDTDGSTVLATVTDTISYSGPFETSRARSIVVS